jgi:predicted DNA-binding mobile mystery protein A
MNQRCYLSPPKSLEFKRLHLHQLDQRLGPWRLVGQTPPRTGWIASIRQALGMGVNQLARRMGVSPSAVVQLERREARGAVTLESLRRAAEAMDSRLVYAIVPNGTLETVLKRQAERTARARLQRVGHTMKLEGQDVLTEETNRQQHELVQRLLFEQPRTLWDDDHHHSKSGNV